jgi:hypothetical protein
MMYCTADTDNVDSKREVVVAIRRDRGRIGMTRDRKLFAGAGLTRPEKESRVLCDERSNSHPGDNGRSMPDSDSPREKRKGDEEGG